MAEFLALPYLMENIQIFSFIWNILMMHVDLKDVVVNGQGALYY